MKLYRLSRGKMVAGICAGIADLYKFDVTLVRLAAVFITVITGVWPGVITYLVGWYLMPEYESAPSEEEKVGDNKDK